MQLLTRVAVAATVTLILLFGGYWLWETRPFRTVEPVKPPEVQLAESEQNCLEVLAYDDGKTPLQQKFMVHSAMNLSEERGLTVCEIYKQKLTLASPSEDGTKAPRYPEAAAWLEGLPMYGDQGNAARAKLEVARILKERRQDYDKYPCLASATRYIRLPKWGTYQDRGKMDVELELLFDDKQGARVYGPKGSEK